MPSYGDLVARGTRSGVYAYGADAVIKVPDRTTPEAWILAEARYATAARTVGAPAPRLLEVVRVKSRAASVWEWVRGPSMWEEVLAAPSRASDLGRQLADLQLELFALAPPLALPSQHDRLVNKIRRSALMIDPKLADALRQVPPRTRRPRLCHGDLHPGNVILSDAGAVVIDWFDASLGEPLAEVARSTLLMTSADDGAATPMHLPGATRQILEDLTRGYSARVMAALSATTSDLERWTAVEAVARLAEGVARSTLLEVWRNEGHASPAP